jgi:branched-chain amino acid transport system permease protein
MLLFIQLVITGIQTGLLYALTAAGFAMIFGATRIFHVAQGAAFALAGYTFLAAYKAALGWPLASLLATAVAIMFGLSMERWIYRPIQRHEASFFTVFVASFGVTIITQSAIEVLFGRGFVTLSTSLTDARPVLPGIYIAPVFWIAMVMTAALFLGLTAFLRFTRAGIGLRALSESRELLQAYGLSSSRPSVLAFGIGSALCVPGAILTAAVAGLQPSIGAHVMLISLAATIVGGVGSIIGAACGGLLLGVAENLSVTILNTQWSEAASFVVLFVFILLRPRGLFGIIVAR